MSREPASHEARPSEPRVGNDISANITGSVLQAGAIHGDVHVRHAGGGGLVPHQLPLPTRDLSVAMLISNGLMIMRAALP